MRSVDVAVIGGGQAGLAAGYYLRRAGLDFVILDDQVAPGGAWQHGWDSLRLFSPASVNPLPGWGMRAEGGDTFPSAEHVVDYLSAYEDRYELPVIRAVEVRGVHDDGPYLRVSTDVGSWQARFVISATGTWSSPFVPAIPGAPSFQGRQLHSSTYRAPEEFAGRRVVVVGGGNSAAQILAEVSLVAETVWVTKDKPIFMPSDVDGRVLFDRASQRARAGTDAGSNDGSWTGLGDIVMVPAVKAARDRGDLTSRPMFDEITPAGVAWHADGHVDCEAIIWCTGFRAALRHLAPLGLHRPGGVPRTAGTQSLDEPRLFFLGYGDWTGFASATIIGVGGAAKTTVATIAEHLHAGESREASLQESREHDG